MSENGKIWIGISSCLLGNQVRFAGGHKYDKYITHTLGKFFGFVPVCPEVECGLSVPRSTGGGFFARVFMERLPTIAVEEGRLHDVFLRQMPDL